jgi:hypothetical protein
LGELPVAQKVVICVFLLIIGLVLIVVLNAISPGIFGESAVLGLLTVVVKYGITTVGIILALVGLAKKNSGLLGGVVLLIVIRQFFFR